MDYHYDPLGRRIGKHSQAIVYDNPSAGSGWRNAEVQRQSAQRGLGTTLYGWEGDTLACEIRQDSQNAGAITTTHYLYEPNSFVPMLQVVKTRGNPTNPATPAVHWYQCDHLGTPMELTDAEGHLAWAAQYKAFGEAQIEVLKQTQHDQKNPLGLERKHQIQNNIRFQGQYWDEESGLHYNRYRYYDPSIGRYISKDPIGLDGG